MFFAVLIALLKLWLAPLLSAVKSKFLAWLGKTVLDAAVQAITQEAVQWLTNHFDTVVTTAVHLVKLLYRLM